MEACNFFNFSLNGKNKNDAHKIDKIISTSSINVNN